MKFAKLAAPAIVAIAVAAPVHAETGFAPTARCDLPTTRDVIIWEKFPNLLADALEVGDADLVQLQAHPRHLGVDAADRAGVLLQDRVGGRQSWLRR